MKKNNPVNKPVKQQPNKNQVKTTPVPPPNKTTNNKQTIAELLSWKEKAIVALLIVALSYVLYSNTIPFGYTFDDKLVVTRNEYTQQGISGIGGILTHDLFTSYFKQQQQLVPGGRYRPLPIITLAIEWEFFAKKNAKGEMEGNPHVSHFVNIALYALSGIVMFLLLSKIFASMLANRPNVLQNLRNRKLTLWLPALASMIFIVHPLHTEVVANIKSRDDIMVLLGSLLTLWLTINYLDTRKWWYMALATFVFFCALMSKENAVTFLAVIPLTVHFFTNHSLKRNLVSVVPLLGATVVFTIIRYKVLGTIIGDVLPELMNDPFLQATKAQKYATIFYTLGLYVKLLVYPNSLTFDYYPYHIPLINAGDWRMALSLIFYVAIGIVALLQFRKKTIVSYSIWFYLFTLSIVSNLFVPIGAFMGERFIYMSSLAFCLVVAYGVIYLFAHVLKLKTPVFAAAVAVVFLLIALPFGYKTIDRNKVWESDYTLFTTDVQTSQNSAYGNLVAGKQFYFKAKEIKDSTERKKYFDLAITHLTKATVIHPRYVNALFFLSEAHYAYNENYQKSLEYLLRLEKLSPDNVDVQYRLGAIYAKYTNDWDNAIKHLKRSLELKPDNFTAMSNLAAVYANSQRYAESIQWFEKMNQLQPNNKEVLSNLRSIYMLLNDQAKVAEYDLKLQQLNK